MLIIIQISNVMEPIPKRNFRKINGIPVIEYLLERLKADSLMEIVLATSDREEDDIFETVCTQCDVDIYRGDYYDVAMRFVGIGEKYSQENFVKINGNCPFVDIEMLKELYHIHVKNQYDYSYDEHIRGIIWGMGCEIYNVEFLKEISKKDLSDNQKQTIGLYIRQNQSLYKVYCHNVYSDGRPSFKLNIESEKDIEVVNEIASNVETINYKTIEEYLLKHPLIAEFNQEERPKEVGVEKLFFNLDKVNSIMKKDSIDMTYPVSVELTLTNACNLKCVYCSDAMLRKKQGTSEMITFDCFKRLFKDLADGGTKGIVIEGGGEPTLYSKFESIVDAASKAGLAIGLITNGVRRLAEKTLEKFEWIRVSLDASTSEEYMNLKGVDAYEKVLDNVAFYAKHCPTVGVGYVVTAENISQIESLVIRLREYKTSYIQCRPVVDNDELYPKNVDLSYLKNYATRDFGVQVDGMIENAESGNHGLSCYANSITSVISGDGSVYICGRLNIYDWLEPIGNITNQSFGDIWHGEKRIKQSKMIRDASFCKGNCPQCRISKFNVLFEKINQIKSVHFI